MKGFVFVLSAISLSMALPTVIDTPGLDHASAVAIHMLFPQTPTQVIETHDDQSPTKTQAPGGGAHAGSNTNGGYAPDNITEITDEYLFRLPINEFEAKRDSRHPATLD